MKNRTIIHVLFVIIFAFSWEPGSAGGSEKELPVGSAFPPITLPTPQSAEAAAYLELPGSKAFSLSQIPAKLMVMEFFSVVCPVCHRQAPRANQIYNFINNDRKLGKDIKMIGVALGNNSKQVPIYAKNFNVAFPLFPDPDKAIQKTVNVEHIPLTVVIDKNGRVLSSHLGVIKDLDLFFRELRQFHKKQ